LPPRWLTWTFAALLVFTAAYGAWWRYSASLMESALEGFRVSGAGWDRQTWSGFPLRLRATLDNPRYSDTNTAYAWSAQRLSVETLPWSAAKIQLMAYGRQSFRAGPTMSPSLTVSGEAKESGVSLSFDDRGLPKQLDVAAQDADANVRGFKGEPVGIKGDILAAHWRIDPDDTDLKDGRDYDVALNGTAVKLTGVELPFGPEIEEIRLEVTLRGVPALQGVDGAMDLISWRLLGAPLTVRRLTFVSGGVDIQGAGELTTGPDGTLEGQLNLTIGGLDKIVNMLSARGAIPPEAKSTLFVTSTMLSATGAKVPMPLAFKGGKTFLGPVLIGPAPRFVR
jgi:hypothetical protein